MTNAPARSRSASAAARLAASPLVRSGGVRVVPLLDAAQAAALADEARSCHAADAAEARVDEPGSDLDRGNPERWLESATGGPLLRRLFVSAGLGVLLESLTGCRWQPLGEQGSFSYYRRAGHHLGLHRDIRTCDLAVIVGVEDSDPDGEGLVVYPGRTREPLAAVRASPDAGARSVVVRPGTAAVLLGGLVPHRVTAVGPERVRIVAPLCFQLTERDQRVPLRTR